MEKKYKAKKNKKRMPKVSRNNSGAFKHKAQKQQVKDDDYKAAVKLSKALEITTKWDKIFKGSSEQRKEKRQVHILVIPGCKRRR